MVVDGTTAKQPCTAAGDGLHHETQHSGHSPAPGSTGTNHKAQEPQIQHNPLVRTGFALLRDDQMVAWTCTIFKGVIFT